MTRAERLALLGDEAVARVRREAEAAPPMDAMLRDALRRILTRPARRAAPAVLPAADGVGLAA
ncbi:hypothetical protein [Streptomyces sp. A0592]|uniref:hypothetical protein n=1 Tax=Streptomyces sp. A0592 TaxID=2563099 RepID=UPI00109E8F3A|nr:hypothetical protein [Streptomyces sp. A0592]THA82706.1 hypothetical protein E6U81_19365 [Streptomyces sp. A0592]